MYKTKSTITFQNIKKKYKINIILSYISGSVNIKLLPTRFLSYINYLTDKKLLNSIVKIIDREL